MAAGKGLMKQVQLSEELTDFMGKATSTRAQITKKIWEHIKENDLQDPNNRRMIIPDDVLEPILGSKKLSMFDLTKRVSDHVLS
ncbi:MAG: hypothetical protein HC883_02980 [Bdellovibrionaceae bacterium]|nr:hypothetical protein [Pseudobdellovibrionaceae bacterium]